MRSRSMIYILINYIFLMSLTIHAIIIKSDLVHYLKNIFAVFVFVNVIILSYEVIRLTIVQVKKESSFELDIVDSEEDIKNLLKEVDEQDSLESSFENEYEKEQKFDTYEQEKDSQEI